MTISAINWGELKDIPAGELKAADFQRVLNDAGRLA